MNSIIRDEPTYSDDEIIELARSVEPHDFDRIAPPPQVWNSILAELEVAVASQEASARRRSQRWFASTRILAVAAATLLMVGVAVVTLTDPDGNDDQVTQLATAVMTDDGLPVSTSETADARVLCDDDACYVEVDLTALPDAGAADLELWVINGDVTDMHSLGLVTSSGQFPLPPGVDPDDFPIVDISIEPRDGEPTHSGQSVLRGVFEQV